MSKELRLHLEIAEETKRLTMEGLEFNSALRKAKEMYKKSCSLPGSIRNNDTKTTTSIISDNEDLDNGEIYNIKTGQTIRDLI